MNRRAERAKGRVIVLWVCVIQSSYVSLWLGSSCSRPLLRKGWSKQKGKAIWMHHEGRRTREGEESDGAGTHG
jgi:hypothetical protein